MFAYSDHVAVRKEYLDRQHNGANAFMIVAINQFQDMFFKLSMHVLLQFHNHVKYSMNTKYKSKYDFIKTLTPL